MENGIFSPNIMEIEHLPWNICSLGANVPFFIIFKKKIVHYEGVHRRLCGVKR